MSDVLVGLLVYAVLALFAWFLVSFDLDRLRRKK